MKSSSPGYFSNNETLSIGAQEVSTLNRFSFSNAIQNHSEQQIHLLSNSKTHFCKMFRYIFPPNVTNGIHSSTPRSSSVDRPKPVLSAPPIPTHRPTPDNNKQHPFDETHFRLNYNPRNLMSKYWTQPLVKTNIYQFHPRGIKSCCLHVCLRSSSSTAATTTSTTTARRVRTCPRLLVRTYGGGQQP